MNWPFFCTVLAINQVPNCLQNKCHVTLNAYFAYFINFVNLFSVVTGAISNDCSQWERDRFGGRSTKLSICSNGFLAMLESYFAW